MKQYEYIKLTMIYLKQTEKYLTSLAGMRANLSVYVTYENNESLKKQDLHHEEQPVARAIGEKSSEVLKNTNPEHQRETKDQQQIFSIFNQLKELQYRKNLQTNSYQKPPIHPTTCQTLGNERVKNILMSHTSQTHRKVTGINLYIIIIKKRGIHIKRRIGE